MIRHLIEAGSVVVLFAWASWGTLVFAGPLPWRRDGAR